MKDYPSFITAIARDGELWLSPAQKNVMQSYLVKHDGEYIKMEYSQPTKGRSNNQNRYMWGVIYTMIAAETGHTTEEIHEFMKSMFLPREFLKVGETIQQLTKSTTTLSTTDMETYLEHIRAFAASELNLVIPLPQEIS